MRKRPTLRWNNGSIVIRVRIDGEDKRIYRLGRSLKKVQEFSYLLHQVLLLLKKSRCLNISSVCRAAIAEKWERLEAVQ